MGARLADRRLAQRLCGLYAIADTGLLAAERFDAAVDAALRGGARLVQYRDKSTDADRRVRQAKRLVGFCRQYDALAIINDDVELAVVAEADGVHLGEFDGTIAAARGQLGAGRIIGRSCYDSLTAAHAASQDGADYIAFGAFYPSATKPNARRADADLLRRARAELTEPIAVIGGLTPDHAAPLIDAGADMVAAIGGLFGVGDVHKEAARFAALFDGGKSARQ